MTSSPPATSASLLANSTRLPAFSAVITGPSPAMPTTESSTVSQPLSSIARSLTFAPVSVPGRTVKPSRGLTTPVSSGLNSSVSL